MEHSCIIFFKIHALAKEEKLFEGFSIFSSGGNLVQWGRTVLAILVESYPRNLPVKLFQNLSSRRSRLKFFSIYSPGGHFVQRSGTIWVILVEGQPRNISVKLFQNLYTKKLFKTHFYL